MCATGKKTLRTVRKARPGTPSIGTKKGNRAQGEKSEVSKLFVLKKLGESRSNCGSTPKRCKGGKGVEETTKRVKLKRVRKRQKKKFESELPPDGDSLSFKTAT